MTEEKERVSEAAADAGGAPDAFDRLRGESSAVVEATVSAAKESVANVQKGLDQVEECIGSAVGRLEQHAEYIRANPMAGVLETAGIGFLVGWLVTHNKEMGRRKETGMGLGETETIKTLQKKLREMHNDLSDLTSAAGDDLHDMVKKLRKKYESTSKTVCKFVADNPVKTSVGAAVVGVGLGFLLHSLIQRHD